MNIGRPVSLPAIAAFPHGAKCGKGAGRGMVALLSLLFSFFTDGDLEMFRVAPGTAHAGNVHFYCTPDGKTIYAMRLKGFVIFVR